MKILSRENAKLVVVAVFCVMVGSVTPAVADAAQRAIAPNAHKVDGFHAVNASSRAPARKGKLVATSTSTGRLPDNIIANAPNAARLGGKSLQNVMTQWLTVDHDGTILGQSPGASSVKVSRVAVGTYCFTKGKIIDSSVAGNVQSRLNGFQDLTMVVSSTVNTTACDGKWLVYTAKSGAPSDEAFTLTFALAP